MSHVATIDVEVKDLDGLGEACRRLGLELVRGQETYRCWYTATPDESREAFLMNTRQTVADLVPEGVDPADIGKCKHAIRVIGDETAYEIGLVNRRDGRPGYSLLWDEYRSNEPGRALFEKVGKSCSNLRQQYALVVARKNALAQGFRVLGEQRLENGTVQLRLAR